MNRIKRISMTLMDRYGDMFSVDFDKNKEIINKVAVIRSKGLRNEIAGYITGFLRSRMNGKDEVQAETEAMEGVEGEGEQEESAGEN